MLESPGYWIAVGRITLSQVPKFSMTKSARQMGHKGRQDLGYGPVERYCMVRASLLPHLSVSYKTPRVPHKEYREMGWQRGQSRSSHQEGEHTGWRAREGRNAHRDLYWGNSERLAPAASPGIINWSPK